MVDAESSPDFWDPENYPWEVGEDSPIAESTHEEGYEGQWELIARHVADGGVVDTAPYPSLRKYAAFIHRPIVEGIRRARVDAALLIGSGS